MQYKTEVVLPEDATYRVSFDVEIATGVPGGCFGVGAPPERVARFSLSQADI
jgi:hypothetical protein